MGDVSVIARRMGNGQVQYGWSGNGGTFPFTGLRLLYWYDDPEMVEYLFGLGQLRHLYEPHSEETDHWMRTYPTGEPHWLGSSEREIFSQIAFIDVGYFYDLDNRWYYVSPGPFRIKIPLELVYNSVDPESQSGFPEGELLADIDRRVIQKIMERYEEDEAFRSYLKDKDYDREAFQAAMETVLRKEGQYGFSTGCMQRLWEEHRNVFGFFDDWVVICPNEDNTEIRDILMRKKEDKHLETIHWESPPVKKDVKMEDILLELDDQVLPELKKLLPSLGMTLEELAEFFFHWCAENPELAKERLLQWQEQDKTEEKEGHDNG